MNERRQTIRDTERRCRSSARGARHRLESASVVVDPRSNFLWMLRKSSALCPTLPATGDYRHQKCKAGDSESNRDRSQESDAGTVTALERSSEPMRILRRLRCITAGSECGDFDRTPPRRVGVKYRNAQRFQGDAAFACYRTQDPSSPL